MGAARGDGAGGGDATNSRRFHTTRTRRREMWLQRGVGSAMGREAAEVQCRERGGRSARHAEGDADCYMHIGSKIGR